MLTNFKQYIFTRQTLFLLCIFFLIRAISYILAPYIFIQNILAGLLGLTFIILYIKKPMYAWYLLLGEIFLGGGGHFLELFGISLRTLFLLLSILCFTTEKFLHRIRQKSSDQKQDEKNKLLIPQNHFIVFVLFAFGILWAVINGMIQGNDTKLIIQDTIPFAFFALVLPLHHLFKEKNGQILLLRLVSVFILGSALFSLFTFILFSSGSVLLQEPYYKWFRDVVGGKITDLGNGFWRIVSPEHLLILPITLILASLAMKKEKNVKIIYIPLLLCLFILVLNLSRGYFLALVLALIPLFYKHSFKRWFLTSCFIGVSSLILFSGTYFIASHGKSFGLEVFGLRLSSFTSPQREESSYTRSALLQPIIKKIQEKPIFGSGLGSTVSFVNPITHNEVTTPQFDWGYLEILTEFGLLGFFLYLIFLGSLGYYFIRYIQTISLFPDFTLGVFAGFIALLVATLTSPVLFHVFGVLYITTIMALIFHSQTFTEKWKRTISFLLRKFL